MVAYSFINFSNDELLQLFPEQSLEKKEIKRMVINLETQETNCKTYNVVPKTIKGTMDILKSTEATPSFVSQFPSSAWGSSKMLSPMSKVLTTNRTRIISQLPQPPPNAFMVIKELTSTVQRGSLVVNILKLFQTNCTFLFLFLFHDVIHLLDRQNDTDLDGTRVVFGNGTGECVLGEVRDVFEHLELKLVRNWLGLEERVVAFVSLQVEKA